MSLSLFAASLVGQARAGLVVGSQSVGRVVASPILGGLRGEWYGFELRRSTFAAFSVRL